MDTQDSPSLYERLGGSVILRFQSFSDIEILEYVSPMTAADTLHRNMPWLLPNRSRTLTSWDYVSAWC